MEVGIIPGTANRNAKRDLDLTYEEDSGALVLLWSEYFSYLNQIHLAILRSGTWETVALAPNLGMPRAFNPRMLLSHHAVRYDLEDGTADHGRTGRCSPSSGGKRRRGRRRATRRSSSTRISTRRT